MSFDGAVYIAVVAVVCVMTAISLTAAFWARQQCKRAEYARDVTLGALATINAIRSTPPS
ncbi:hypothetical protein [Actinomadura violacea]|uniref:Uncharacterized protein n=1 Tax=Actinomadura violacea TaxID=2819934 RepID=A0ABS3RYA0_9ACTN|nr:hypothetical protein [Actinomadura violacea]MBO2461735.1 hypothetical protein [Actinomadura violacea]